MADADMSDQNINECGVTEFGQDPEESLTVSDNTLVDHTLSQGMDVVDVNDNSKQPQTQSPCADTGSEDEDSRPSSPEDSRPSSPEDSRQSSPYDSRQSSQEDSRQSLPEDSTQTSPEDSRQSLAEDSRQSSPEDSRQSLPEDSRQSLPEDSRQSSPEDSRQSLAEDSRQSSPEDSRQSLPEDSRQSSPEDSRQSLAEDCRQSSPEDSRQSSPEGSRQSLAEDSRQSSPEDSRQSSPEDSTQSSPEDSRQSLPGDSRQSLAEDSRQSSSENSRQSSPEDSRQSSPEDSRQSLPEDTCTSSSVENSESPLDVSSELTTSEHPVPEVSSARVISLHKDDYKGDIKKSSLEHQRSHIAEVSKALDIDLELSSEDEEEIKTIKDQIPEVHATPKTNNTVQRPTTLDTSTKKKIVPNLDLLNDNDIDIAVSPISTDDDIGISVDDEQTPNDLTTPDVLNNSMFDGEVEWTSTASSTPVDPIPEYSAREEFEDERHWKSVQISDRWYKIDMKVIDPYKKVLSHGGYYGDGFNAIVVFSACYLPDRRRRDYHYVMDNLFLYVISTLELLVVEDYMIVYFHGATPRHRMPSLRWLKRCYDMIDRRLRKNLKGLLIVHPTIWLKTLFIMMKPFISSKFSSKLRYIKNLAELTYSVPTEYIYIPDEVRKTDRYYNSGQRPPTRKFINM